MRKLKATQERVLKSLDAKKGIEAGDVAAALTSKAGPMTRCLLSMVDLGLVRKVGETKFTRTAAGTKALKDGGV